MIPLILLLSGVIILTDSLYYGELTVTKLWELTMDWEDWKVAPFNFIMYNVVPGNVARHGEHPHYTHLLVNLPLLLGPLAPILVVTVLSWLSDCLYLQWKLKPDVSLLVHCQLLYQSDKTLRRSGTCSP